MKNQILNIINKVNKKQVSQTIKRDKELYNWLLSNTPNDCQSISERVDIIINGDKRFCEYNNRRKFNRGKYTFCNHQSKCICNKINTSKKVKNTKSKYSDEENQNINSKREQTNLKTYGSKFISQTDSWKEKIKSKQVLHTQYHIPNHALEILNNKDKFINYLKTKSRKDILKEFNIYYGTFNNYAKKYGVYEYCRSYLELDMKNFLDENNIRYEQNTRSIIPPKELDFYLPEQQIAIEMCGLYWHSETQIDKDYHYKKWFECNKKGIHLIQIFEDEWLNKTDLVKNRLLHKFGKSNFERIHARKCQVKKISNIKDFQNLYHIQGYTGSKINYGLFYNDNLVSVMTFGQRHFVNNEFELIRFCSSKNVIGGASKLFKYYLKNNNNHNIISYSCNRWNNGNLYKQLGFKLQKISGPGYAYTDNIRRYHRYNFAKYKLVNEGFDSEKSAVEIMKERGYSRIWDAGQTKFYF